MRTNLKYCRYCNAAIVWARVERGWLPLEPKSVPDLDRHRAELAFSPTAGHVAHRCKGKGAA